MGSHCLEVRGPRSAVSSYINLDELPERYAPNGKSNGKPGPNCGMALAEAASRASLVTEFMLTDLGIDEIRNRAGKSPRKPQEAGEYAGDV